MNCSPQALGPWQNFSSDVTSLLTTSIPAEQCSALQSAGSSEAGWGGSLEPAHRTCSMMAGSKHTTACEDRPGSSIWIWSKI